MVCCVDAVAHIYTLVPMPSWLPGHMAPETEREPAQALVRGVRGVRILAVVMSATSLHCMPRPRDMENAPSRSQVWLATGSECWTLGRVSEFALGACTLSSAPTCERSERSSDPPRQRSAIGGRMHGQSCRRIRRSPNSTADAHSPMSLVGGYCEHTLVTSASRKT